MFAKAVSYEDIKSAEATIKGSSLNSPNPSLNEPSTPSVVESPSVNGPIVPSSTSSTTTFNFNNTGQILTTVPINSPPISQQGVSSLSSIFGESITKNVSSNNLHGLSNQLSAASSTSLSSTTSSTNTAIGSSLGGVPSSTVTASTPTASTTNATSVNTNNNSTSATTSGAGGSTNESNEKDAIIANDIETDKLLTVIEKSKGFSDTYSTTRRLRNRAIPFGSFQPSFNNVYNDRFSAKTQSLIDESQPSSILPFYSSSKLLAPYTYYSLDFLSFVRFEDEGRRKAYVRFNQTVKSNPTKQQRCKDHYFNIYFFLFLRSIFLK